MLWARRLPCVKGAPATAGEGLFVCFTTPPTPIAATSPYTGEAMEAYLFIYG